MKRLLILGVFLILLSPTFVLATDTIVDSNSSVNILIDQSDKSIHQEDYGSTNHNFPYVGKHDSSSTFGVQPVYNLDKLGDMRGLRKDWAKMGWRVLTFPERLVREGIPKKVLEKSRASWLSDRANDTGFPVLEKADGKVFPINFYPLDGSALAVRHSKAYAQDEKYLPTEAQYESIYHGAQSGAKYFVVLYNIHYLSKTKNASIGTTLIGNAAVGPASEPGKRLLSGGGGSGFGTAQSWVWERGGYWTIFFDRKPLPPTPKKAVTKTQASAPTAKTDTAAKVKNDQVRKPLPSITFDQDSAIIEGKNLQLIEKFAGMISQDKSQLLQNGTHIMVFGSASSEGSDPYNALLSRLRSIAVHDALAKKLINKFGAKKEEVNKILKIGYSGEDESIKRYIEKNNRAVVLLASKRY